MTWEKLPNGFEVYKPEYQGEPIAQNATLGVKFNQVTVILKSFLDHQKIPYELTDLEETPLGLGIFIKKDKKCLSDKPTSEE